MTDIDQIDVPNVVFKIIIVGDAGGGKSCLLMRFAKDGKDMEYNPTIGIEFQSKVVSIDNKTSLKLQIWDTAGQESFRSIVRSFYRNSSAVFLVYNIADKASYDNLDIWYNEARSNSMENSIFVLVGAQKDRESEREVSYDEGLLFMKNNQIDLFFETSSLDGSNVEQSFLEAGKLIYQNYMKQQTTSDFMTQNQPKSRIKDAYSIDDNSYYEGQQQLQFALKQEEAEQEKKEKKCC